MNKPLIGVLGIKMEKPLPGQKVTMDYVNEAYNKAIMAAGGVPFLLPVPEKPNTLDQLLAMCDGILFPGGADVDPKFYGEQPHEKIGPVHQQWDAFWFHALDFARNKKMPVFGICRGMQLINIGLKGDLYQDISESGLKHLIHSQKQNRDYPLHEVEIVQGSLFHELIGADGVYTNTFHHQIVRNVGKGLKVTGRTSDGVIEAMENEDGSILLVQFHPEELQNTVPATRNLFKHLVNKAAEFRKSKRITQK